MNTPDDRVALSIEEQRALTGLEDQAGRDHPRLRVSLTAGWRYPRLHSRRVRDLAAALSFADGIALMLLTFVRWPIVAVGGLVLQVVSLRALLIRWRPFPGPRLQSWIETRKRKGVT